MDQKSGPTRGKWVKDREPVVLLRAQHFNDLKTQNWAQYTIVVRNGRQLSPATWVCIFPQELSAEGLERFQNQRQAPAPLRRLRSLDRVKFQTARASRRAHRAPPHALRCESPHRATRLATAS